jgi:hypothetical protein
MDSKRKIIEIKWIIKNKEYDAQYILLLFHKVKDNIRKYFGKFHPFLS